MQRIPNFYRIGGIICSAIVLLAGSPSAQGAIKTWDGSSSGNWNTSANWTNNAVPVDGDSLVFPANAARFILTNNITGLNVKSITFSGSNYVLRGNSILLTNGLSAAYISGTNTVEFGITLGSNQTFTVSSGGNLGMSSSLALNGFDLTVNNSSTTELSGVISGTGDFTKDGVGTLTLSGSNANTFVGTTVVNSGTLALNKNVNNGAIPGDLIIGLVSGHKTVQHLRGDQIANAAIVTVNTNGVFDLNGFTDIIGGLVLSGGLAASGTGAIRLSGNLTANPSAASATITGELELFGTFNRTFTVAAGGGSPDLLISAQITGLGGLIKSGAGELWLSASNTYPGTTFVNQGTLLINGVQPQSLVVVNSGTLGGRGVIGSVVNSSSLAPGATVGILTCSNVNFLPPSSYDVELNGVFPGAYDQLKVRGTNTIQGARLNLSVADGLGIPQGHIFTVITNDGVEPITGAFAGLPEGTVTNVNGLVLRISYRGGSGNDVTLTVLSATHIWNGSGITNNYWTYLYNWVGKIAPMPGDSLIFPAGVADVITTNDFPAGTVFSSITVASNSYVLDGNALQISNGIHGALSASTANVNMPLTLARAQTFTNNGAGTLNFNAAVDNSGNDLIVRVNVGTNIFQSINGTGGLIKEGPGTLRFAGSLANTYSGVTTVNEGVLELAKPSSTTSITGDLRIGDGIGGPGADVVRLLNPNQIADTCRITVNSSGLFVAASDTIGGLSGNGQVLLNGPLVVNIPSGTNSFDGTISGAAGLSTFGAGTLILTGSNPYSGITSLQPGATLQVDGFQPASDVALGGSARFQGSGTVGNITCTGNANVIAPGSGTGILTCSNFLHTGSSTLQIELNGPAPRSGYDQLNVRGTVNISNLALNASLNFRSSLSNQFVIINNDGADAVNGRFTGKAEGSVFTIGGEQFRITYAGGDGNDVMLTQISGIFIPVLALENLNANTLRLLWHTNATGFTLESNTNLLTTNWLTTSPSPTIVGTNFVVTNTIIAPKKFYRLRKP